MGIAVVVASVLAGVFVLVSGAVVWAVLRFTKSFGDFAESQRDLTKVLWQVNETNLALHRSNITLLERMERVQADLQRERVA